MTEDIYGDDLLDELETWFGRFILPTDTEDLALMASWTLHTHVVRECFTTPRLLVDSTLPGSGKTTLLERFCRLCCAGEQVAVRVTCRVGFGFIYGKAIAKVTTGGS